MNKIHYYCILSQCFGQIVILAFDNGFMFNYFDYLGCTGFDIVFLLKMINFLGMFIIIPLAYVAEIKGKKRVGQCGNAIQVLGLILLWSSSFWQEGRLVGLYLGSFIFAIGTSMFRSTWFALLSPLLKKEERVTFFASLRTSWKLCSLGIGFAIQFLMGSYGISISVQIVALLTIFTLIQMVFYQTIPDIKENNKSSELPSFFETIYQMKHQKEFLCILKFKFCVPLLTGCIALIFNLYEKNLLGFSPDKIMFMGNCMFLGSLVGFWAAAWMIKKYGELLVFRLCSCILTMNGLFFAATPFILWPFIVHTATLTFLLGLCLAMIGMAETNIMLELLPEGKKIISSAIWITITQIGFTCSSLVSAFVSNYANNQRTDLSIVNPYSILLLCFLIPLPLFAFRYARQLENIQASKNFIAQT